MAFWCSEVEEEQQPSFVDQKSQLSYLLATNPNFKQLLNKEYSQSLSSTLLNPTLFMQKQSDSFIWFMDI